MGMSDDPIFVIVTVMTWLLPTGVPGNVKLAGEKRICAFVECAVIATVCGLSAVLSVRCSVPVRVF